MAQTLEKTFCYISMQHKVSSIGICRSGGFGSLRKPMGCQDVTRGVIRDCVLFAMFPNRMIDPSLHRVSRKLYHGASDDEGLRDSESRALVTGQVTIYTMI